jgi:hypothetical protein
VSGGGIRQRILVGAIIGAVMIPTYMILARFTPWSLFPRWFQMVLSVMQMGCIPGYVLANVTENVIRSVIGQFPPMSFTDVVRIALNPVVYAVSWVLVTSRGPRSKWNRLGVGLCWTAYFGWIYRGLALGH